MSEPEPVLDLAWGDVLQLQMLQDGSRERYSVRVIGLMHGASLMVTSPELRGRLVMVREGQVFVARGFSRSRASAFTARVLRVCTHPYPYIHLSYPERQQQVVLRSARRAAVTLGAFVQREAPNGGWSPALAAVIGDISIAGMMIDASAELGDVGTRVKVTTHLQLIGMGDHAAILEGTIQTVHDNTGDTVHHRYGVALAQPEEPTALILRAFVYEQLLGNDR